MTILVTGRLTLAETEHRNQTALFLPSDGTQLGVIQGVQAGLALTKTSGMGWQLDIGRAVISPATAANGPVVATVTVAETGTFADGDATRDRIDVVGLQIDETATVTNGNPRVKTVLIQGAYPVSGSPVTPVIPAGTIGCASAKIAAGTSAGGGGWNTANLVDLRNLMGLRTASFATPLLSPTSNVQFQFGLMTPNVASTFNNDFATPATGGFITITRAGVYAIHANLLPWVPPAATNLQIVMGSTHVANAVAGQYVGWETSVSWTGYVPAGTVFLFQGCMTTGVTTGGNVNITKLQ